MKYVETIFHQSNNDSWRRSCKTSASSCPVLLICYPINWHLLPVHFASLIPDWQKARVKECQSDWVPEWQSEWQIDRVTEWVTDWQSDRVTEWQSERVIDCQSARVKECQSAHCQCPPGGLPAPREEEHDGEDPWAGPQPQGEVRPQEHLREVSAVLKVTSCVLFHVSCVPSLVSNCFKYVSHL